MQAGAAVALVAAIKRHADQLGADGVVRTGLKGMVSFAGGHASNVTSLVSSGAVAAIISTFLPHQRSSLTLISGAPSSPDVIGTMKANIADADMQIDCFTAVNTLTVNNAAGVKVHFPICSNPVFEKPLSFNLTRSFLIPP